MLDIGDGVSDADTSSEENHSAVRVERVVSTIRALGEAACLETTSRGSDCLLVEAVSHASSASDDERNPLLLHSQKILVSSG